MGRKIIPASIIFEGKTYVSVREAAKMFGKAKGKEPVLINRVRNLIVKKRLAVVNPIANSNIQYLAEEDVQEYIKNGIDNPHPGNNLKAPKLQ